MTIAEPMSHGRPQDGIVRTRPALFADQSPGRNEKGLGHELAEMGTHYAGGLAGGGPVRLYRSVGRERGRRFYIFLVIFLVLLVLGLVGARAARGP